MRHISPLAIFSAILLLMMHCTSPETQPERRFHRDSTFILKDLKYGDDTLNYLDLYLPAKRGTATPVVITIHGGGWVIGDKSHFNSEYAVEFYKQGMIVANINYRMLKGDGSVTYKSMMADVKHVVDFIHRHAEKYGIDRRQMSLVGYSAGAHIALLYAHMADTANDIRSVVSHWGPTNINDLHFKKVVDSVWKSPDRLPLLLGEPYVFNGFAAIHCSPVYFLKNKPTLMIHGTKDDLVPFEQSVTLNDSLSKKGIRHFLIAMKDHGHHGPDATLADSVKRTVHDWLFE